MQFKNIIINFILHFIIFIIYLKKKKNKQIKKKVEEICTKKKFKII